jgi:hypothetical protein
MTDRKKSPSDQVDSADPLDPFDPKALRLPQDFTETANVKKLLETVPIGRFNKQDFFRTFSPSRRAVG